MILDGHIHLIDAGQSRAGFRQQLAEAGVDGGVLISLPPRAFPVTARQSRSSSGLRRCCTG